MGLLDLEGIECVDDVARPGIQAVVADGAFGVAEPDDVGCDHAEVRRERGHGEAPVCPRADAGARAMDEEHRATARVDH